MKDSWIAKELFGLTISEGAIANMFRRLRTSMDAATAAIRYLLTPLANVIGL